MIVDTSAWVEYLRKTGSPTHLTLQASVRSGQPIGTPAAVVTEVLSGTNRDNRAAELLKLLNRFEILVPSSIEAYEGAARIYRICRRAGFTIRSTVDCLVAATALDKGRPLLARNRDFAVIARHTGLELVIPSDTGPPKKPSRGWSGE
ncbi:MAG: PIN domain nuclease [Gemmatimonadota bacterium]|nr:PIN domain nuclease [Gemmatimonadota bacterium]MDE2805585.1 PIN domain nuclease [Gemmatimonadota bacterium]